MRGEPSLNYSSSALGLQGLGGWLVVVQVALYITGIQMLLGLVTSSIPNFTTEVWSVLTSPESEYYHPMWSNILVFEAIYNVFFLAFVIYILVLFYQKKSIVPRLIIVFYSLSLLFLFFNQLMLSQIPLAQELLGEGGFRHVGRALLACAIWIPYFLRSERVRITFVR
ncbi:hypothetical protein PA598K_04610 [Paenibacillus sp. 598K]|uniref:DUF2569 domain-containing protein n=1 Tax=Paenibacillus sp. 598K TaxID=1117987 RepID=UPI000FFABE1B|nr:DUF2569 domain-containing protein [Paenibacillus sp. 598K]GBF76162.1 hypothetical protein PA598K_04610 [Paenibacillus sp. 598K]